MSLPNGTRAVIEAVSACTGEGLSSRQLAIRAARSALRSAGRRPDQVGMLINTGVYRDEHIIEPAMAPFIQRGIAANSTFPLDADCGTFSFDLSNGGCGFLTAIHVLDGFIRSRRVELALVVTSDADPEPDRSQNYCFEAAGAALLLAPASAEEGFVAFHSCTFGEHERQYRGLLRHVADGDEETQDDRLRLRLWIEESESYVESCIESGLATVEEFSTALGVAFEEIDLFLPSLHPRGFAEALSRRLGLAEKTPVLRSPAPRVHTAATAFGLQTAMADGSWARARNVLFLTVGAGINVSAALYRR